MVMSFNKCNTKQVQLENGLLNMTHEQLVALRTTGIFEYPTSSPFHPPEVYPEFDDTETDASNGIYSAVRQLLFDLGLDRNRFGSSLWDPLGAFVKPGMTVFIKPNTVVHVHEKKKDLFSVIVHPSLIRPILDYTCKALNNNGRIVVGDSQLYSSDYDRMLQASDLGDLLQWYRQKTKVDIQWFDLRLNRAKRTWLYGRWARKKIEHDPHGYRFVDLGDQSLFKGIDPSRLRIAIASHKNMYTHHSGGKHEYLFPRSFLQSDVVINIAKLKTHRRTAVTLALKNYMGIPSYKDSLPHFMTGSVQEGGDQYINPSRRKRLATRLHDVIQSSQWTPIKFVCAILKKMIWNSHFVIPFRDNIYEAMWWGNDTLWRTLGDLNRIVKYSDKNGVVQKTSQRKQLVLVDGIIGGEGDGPLACDAVRSGVLIAGMSPPAVDAIAATEMGFDIERIPLIRNAFDAGTNPIPLIEIDKNNITVSVNGVGEPFAVFRNRPHQQFKPHPQWAGHV